MTIFLYSGYKPAVTAEKTVEGFRPHTYTVREGTPFRSGPLGGPSVELASATTPTRVVATIPPTILNGYRSFAVFFPEEQVVPDEIQGYRFVWISQLVQGGPWI